MATITFILFCFASIVTSSWACTCAPTTDVDIYCNADFVVRVEVFGSTIAGAYRLYQVDVTELVKSNTSSIPAGAEINEHTIVTPIHGSTCGIFLQPGVTQLVAGRYRQFGSTYYMYSNLCINFMEPTLFQPHPDLCYNDVRGGRMYHRRP